MEASVEVVEEEVEAVELVEAAICTSVIFVIPPTVIPVTSNNIC